MRHFWEKVNRGLLLGAVLLIALIVFPAPIACNCNRDRGSTYGGLSFDRV